MPRAPRDGSRELPLGVSQQVPRLDSILDRRRPRQDASCWVTSHYLHPERGVEYQKWLNSPERPKLADRIQKETGFRYLNTYCAILGFGNYDREDWWVGPDWAAFDKIRGLKATNEWVMQTWNFLDQTKPGRARLMRTAR